MNRFCLLLVVIALFVRFEPATADQNNLDKRPGGIDSPVLSGPIDYPGYLVDRYLAVRRLLQEYPQSEAGKSLLPNPDQAAIVKAIDVDFQYYENKDSMTDALTCGVLSSEKEGLHFGVDMHGVYIRAQGPLLATQYNEMGLRIDQGKFYRGIKPDSVAKHEEQKNAITWLMTHDKLTVEQAKRSFDQLAAPRNPDLVYVAKVGEPEFNTLLKEISQGEIVRVRGIYPDRKTIIVDIGTRLDLGENSGTVNQFDTFGYFYLNCLYGNLAAGEALRDPR